MESQAINLFTEYMDTFMVMWPKLLLALVVFVVFYAVGYGSRWLIGRRHTRLAKKSVVATFIGELLFWSALLFGLFSALQTLGFSGLANSLIASAGISAIIFGFAFKDILENFLAGILLTIQKPFKTGDIIEIEGYKGPVKSLDLRTTHMRLADGRDIWIPNAKMVKSVLTNYTRDGQLRHDFAVCISHQEDAEKVRNMLLDFLISQKGILKNPAPNVLMEEIESDGLRLRILFWVDQLSRQNKSDPIARGESMRSLLIRGVKDVLGENQIEFSQSSLLLSGSLNTAGQKTSRLPAK